ncbi:MAG TPA: hypothetical protein VGZ73_08565, partial [Bryobacteraceae bacterium]|nr:hypothetical protein [Bryobacteraceae bacterium]
AEFPEIPGAHVRSLSAKTGQGVAEWLDEIMAGELAAGSKLLDIDYTRYAQAEAALTWLNCRTLVRLKTPLPPLMLLGSALDNLCDRLLAAGIRIAHLKAIVESSTGYIKASVCGNREEPSVEGTLDASPAGVHELVFNIRAVGDPGEIKRTLQAVLDDLPGAIDIRSLQCFRPAAPNPDVRLGMVI